MMKPEDAAALGETRRGTVLGDYLRDRWVPVMRSERAEAGGTPVPIKLFGETVIVFRSPQGGLGIVDEKCPHRGASLTLARNEDCGLRCLYHGWTFDADGKATDVPNEPERSVVRDKVKLGSYPVREQSGAIWGYFGDDVENAVFPEFEFTQLPLSQVRINIATVHANWLQCIEGVVDPTHVPVLHANWLPPQVVTVMKAIPEIEVIEHDYGFTGACVREVPGGAHYARVKEFAMPWYGFVPHNSDEMHTCIIAVPGDDELTYLWYYGFDIDRDCAEDDFSVGVQGGAEHPFDPDNFRSGMPFDPEHVWGQDRSKMADGHYSGLPGLALEDVAILESQGGLQDRTKERLGAMDVLITTLRKRLLSESRAHAAGTLASLQGVDFEDVRAVAAFLPPGKQWRDAPRRGVDTSGLRHGRPGQHPDVDPEVLAQESVPVAG